MGRQTTQPSKQVKNRLCTELHLFYYGPPTKQAGCVQGYIYYYVPPTKLRELYWQSTTDEKVQRSMRSVDKSEKEKKRVGGENSNE